MTYFRQLLSGRQVATEHPAAGQMANFMYLMGDPGTREAVIVDPAWDVATLVDLAQEDGYDVVGALITHYHPDHVGGDLWGVQVEGVGALLERVSVPLYVNRHEAHGLKTVTGVADTDMKRVDDGDVLDIGDLHVRFLHTPGLCPAGRF